MLIYQRALLSLQLSKALDQWIDSPASVLYGAVTTGDTWKFGSFQRVPT